eukprot:2360683-Prymnesium_polylepis.1
MDTRSPPSLRMRWSAAFTQPFVAASNVSPGSTTANPSPYSLPSPSRSHRSHSAVSSHHTSSPRGLSTMVSSPLSRCGSQWRASDFST